LTCGLFFGKRLFMEKKRAGTYTAPMVADYGTLTELTAGQADGNYTDQLFPILTPKKDLTFS
jgi:hypothetical protein